MVAVLRASHVRLQSWGQGFLQTQWKRSVGARICSRVHDLRQKVVPQRPPLFELGTSRAVVGRPRLQNLLDKFSAAPVPKHRKASQRATGFQAPLLRLEDHPCWQALPLGLFSAELRMTYSSALLWLCELLEQSCVWGATCAMPCHPKNARFSRGLDQRALVFVLVLLIQNLCQKRDSDRRSPREIGGGQVQMIGNSSGAVPPRPLQLALHTLVNGKVAPGQYFGRHRSRQPCLSCSGLSPLWSMCTHGIAAFP